MESVGQGFHLLGSAVTGKSPDFQQCVIDQVTEPLLLLGSRRRGNVLGLRHARLNKPAELLLGEA